MNKILKYGLVPALMLMAQVAMAQTAVGSENPSIFTDFLRIMTQQITPIMGKFISVAQGLFLVGITINLWYSGMQWYLSDAGFEQIIAELTKKILYFGFFAFLLGVGSGSSPIIYAIQTMLPQDISTMSKMSGLGGISSLASAPQELIEQGFNAARRLWDKADVMQKMMSDQMEMLNGFTDMGKIIQLFIAKIALSFGVTVGAFSILVAFFFAGFELFITVAEFSLVGSIGAIFLAGAATEWTTDYRNKFFAFLAMYFFKLVTLLTVVAIVLKSMDYAADVGLANLGLLQVLPGEQFNPDGLISGSITFGGGMVLFAWMSWRMITSIPNLFTSVMQASPGSASSFAQGARDAKAGMTNTMSNAGAMAGTTRGAAIGSSSVTAMATGAGLTAVGSAMNKAGMGNTGDKLKNMGEKMSDWGTSQLNSMGGKGGTAAGASTAGTASTGSKLSDAGQKLAQSQPVQSSVPTPPPPPSA